MFTTSLFIFRRDLRLYDNTGLNNALRSSKQIIPCFFLDPRQVRPHQYRSLPAMQCMFQSLRELDSELQEKGSRLHLFLEPPDQGLARILGQVPVDAVFFNRDYTPFSRARDAAIASICKQRKCTTHISHDALLTIPEESKKDDGEPYTMFTPFYKKNSARVPPEPYTASSGARLSNMPLEGSFDISQLDTLLGTDDGSGPAQPFRFGGRKEALKILDTKLVTLTQYEVSRDVPSLMGTSGLSVHHKFGTVSIREVYHAARAALGENTKFLRELYWRDFLTHIAFFYPHVFSGAFKRKFDGLRWHDNEELFKKWCNGITGFPIVDAGMRELLTTGFMHNRVRMIVASFLTKDLHISWRKGEQYFAQKLLDYDPAVNNGSWQWAASTGCDAQPYFRIFNPWLQGAKFDPEASYIKKWIPELRPIPPKQIHMLYAKPASGYPKPIVDHAREKVVSIKMFKELVST